MTSLTFESNKVSLEISEAIFTILRSLYDKITSYRIFEMYLNSISANIVI